MKRLFILLAVLGVFAVATAAAPPTWGENPSTSSGGGSFDGGQLNASVLYVGAMDAGNARFNGKIEANSVDAGQVRTTAQNNAFVWNGGTGSGSATPLVLNASYNSGIQGSITNTAGATANAHAGFELEAAATGGDPRLIWTISSTSFSCGLDNSDSDSFVCSAANVLGTSNWLKVIGTAVQHPGAMSIGTGSAPSYPLHVGGSPSNTVLAGFICGANTASDICIYAAGPTLTGNAKMGDISANATGDSSWTVANTNNSSGTASAKIEARTAGASAGDPKFVWTISGVNNWACGVDNSDSDAFVCGNSETLGTNSWLRSTTAEAKLGTTTIYPSIGMTGSSAPTAGDCDADAERGRMYIETTTNRLYICNGATRGWDYAALTD